MVDVLLTNASYQVLSRIGWQRAVVLVVTGAGEILSAHPTRLVRSQHLSIPLPTIVRLNDYRHVQFRSAESRFPSYRQIRIRDGRRCAYCGGPGDTVDHVVPRSRGGSGHWDNLVCACRVCNNRKADRTPLEAGMRLRWAPRQVVTDDTDQKRVWNLLAAAG